MEYLKNGNWFFLVILLTAFAISCSNDDDGNPGGEPTENIIPERFGIDIPSQFTTGGSPSGRSSNDDLSGNSIYEALGLFINLSEESADIVEGIIFGIRTLNIVGVTALTYESDDDGRTKDLEIIEGGSYEGVNYEFQMLITDVASQDATDGGRAMQVFWNTNPIAGVAILKPYNIDRTSHEDAPDAIYRIEYVEESDLGYDAHMIVTITDLPLDAEQDPFGPDNLKVFVGKQGDVVDIYGNSNHPNARFFTEDTGFSWAFVASGSDEEQLGVAEVGLPPSTLNSTDRSEILETYSLRQVFSDQILEEFPNIGQEIIDRYLTNTEAPGYFDDSGFVQGGTSPGATWDRFESRIQALTPFNPVEIANYTLSFQ